MPMEGMVNSLVKDILIYYNQSNQEWVDIPIFWGRPYRPLLR